MSVSLTEVHAALALFAEAVVGDPVPIEVVEDPATAWPWAPTVSIAPVVRVPAELDDYGTDEANRQAYRALVLHQIVALEVGSVAVDVPRRPSWAEAPSDRVDPVVFGVLLAMVEDLRIDAVTRRRYPGGAAWLDRVLQLALDHLVITDGDVFALVRAATLGADVDWLTPRFGLMDSATLQAVLDQLATVVPPDADVDDSVTATRSICELFGLIGTGSGTNGELVPEDPDNDDPGLSSEEAERGTLNTAGSPTEYEQAEGLSGGEPATDAPMSDSAATTAEDDEASGLELEVVPTSGGIDRRADVLTFVYDEWDFRSERHRRAWCRLVEERLGGEDTEFITDVRARHRMLRSRIRRTFARLRPAELVRVHRSQDGEELDLDVVIESRVDYLSGAPAEDRLHVRRDRAMRDVATAFLVDLSASTSAPAQPPEPPTPTDPDPYDDPLSYAPIWDPGQEPEPVRRVIDVAKDAVALMSDALRELGDQHAIYGFSGKGRDAVEFAVAKDFDDRVSPMTWAAVSEMKPRHYTRMGPAIRHTTAKLSAQAARSKLLIVISDGYPQDVDYGEDRRDREYGMHDTARALRDAEAAGIESFCVTIDPAGHDYLREMCPDNRYLVIDEIEALPEELAKIYLALSS